MSSFFGARAPELVPEHVQDLNLKPAHYHKNVLHERSLSDLNKSRPTIRLVDPLTSSPDVYGKNPFPKSSQILKPTSPTKRTRQANFITLPDPHTRPASRDGGTALIPKPLILKKSSRMSGSTTTSNAETLVADSVFSPTSNRFSVESTLKGTPAPYTVENTPGPLEPLEEQDSSPRAGAEEHLATVPALPENTRHQHVKSSSSMYSSPYDELKPPTPPRLRRRSSSSGLGFEITRAPSSQLEDLSSRPGSAHSGDYEEHQERPDSLQERGQPHVIRYVSSNESIRPQYAAFRPAQAPSRTASSVWSADSTDNLPPLSVGKRAHMHSASLNSHPSLSRLERSHLSTIVSESDYPTSSRFSQASGAATAGNLPRRRTTIASSAYSESVASPSSSPNLDSPVAASSSYGSIPEKMRDDPAVPQPLFSSSAPIAQRPFRSSVREGHTDELDDTIGELQAPPLREKRSGYFVRQRSQTDLRPSSRRSNNTNAETDRWSMGSFTFPQWAWSFYAGRAGLTSGNASRVTLAGPSYASNNNSRVTIAGPQYGSTMSLSRPATRASHKRHDTADTIDTRPGSSHSNWETIYTMSPASRLVPSIFRPRNRARAATDATERGASHDSLGIYQVTAENSENLDPVATAQSTPPTRSTTRRHPLRQNPTATEQPRHAVRHVSNNSMLMHGPQVPLSTDPSYISLPHLVQNQRLSRHLSMWRVPSIDEPFPREILGRGNRQIMAFCLGFLFPPLWIVAAFLALPERPHSNQWAEEGARNDSVFGGRNKERVGVEAEISEGWTWVDERKFLKARWWRTLNRIMSVVGVGILAAIIALAVLAARMPY